MLISLISSSLLFVVTVIEALIVLIVFLLLCGGVRLLVGMSMKHNEPIPDAAKLKKGDIILTGKESIADGWYIQLVNVLSRNLSDRFWTHAAVYKGDGKVIEAVPEGIKTTDLGDYVKTNHYVRAFRHRYAANESTTAQVLSFCESNNGGSYDKRGAFFYWLAMCCPIGFNSFFNNEYIDKWFHIENSYFCSELIAEAYEKAGHPVSPFQPWRVKPADFIGNPLLTEVS